MATEKRLIDANVLWKTLDKAHLFDDGNPRHIAQQTVYEQPTVDAVEVVHGRCIHPKGYVVSNAFFCSVCNHEEVSLHVIHPLHGGGCKADEHGNFYYPPKMNYCPNCGADMRERSNNEEVR